MATEPKSSVPSGPDDAAWHATTSGRAAGREDDRGRRAGLGSGGRAAPALAAMLLTACPSPSEQPTGDGDATTTAAPQTTADDDPSPGTGATSSAHPTPPGPTSGGSTGVDPDTATTVEPPKLDLTPIPDAPNGTTGTTEEPVDCEALAPLPIGFVAVPGAASSEDFVFDDSGHLVNVANAGDLLQAQYGGPSMLLFPGVSAGGAAGTGMRSNGDVVFNSGGQVRRVTIAGSVDVIAAGLSYPNGLAVGMNDRVYVAEQSGGRVVEIDPDTLAVDVVADNLVSPNGLAFDRSYENLYVGSFGGGTVHRINLVTGMVDLYASNIGSLGLDGIVVDACDNVYVTDFGPGIVYRVEGQTHEIVVQLPASWIPNMHFGSGVGGWDSWRLYVMELGGNQVYELDLGVPGIPLPQL